MELPADDVLLRMFAPMAQLGFYSYGKGIYLLVASPDYPDETPVPFPEVQLPLFDGIVVLEESNGVIVRFAM